MKKITSVITLAVALSVPAFAQDKLMLTATIANLPNDTVVYLWGFNGHEYDSTFVKDHSFSFNRPIKGDVYVLQVGRSGDPHHGYPLYMQNSTIHIQGDGPYFNNVKVDGPAYVNDWFEVTKAMTDSTVFPGITTLGEDMDHARVVGDQEKYQELMALDSKYDHMKVDMGKKWVDTHPNSPISAYILNVLMSRFLKPEEASAYLDKLTPAAKANCLAELLKVTSTVSPVTQIGRLAPIFTLSDTAGNKVNLQDFRGKYVLVDFWASWCKPCRADNPRLKAIYDKYKDRNFTILGVSLDSDKDKWLNAIKQDQLTWAHVSDLQGWQNAAAVQYMVGAIPASYLLDPQGVIVAYGRDKEALEKYLNEKLPATAGK